MRAGHRSVLSSLRSYLTDNLEPKEELLDRLVSRGLFTPDDVEEVMNVAIATKRKRAGLIVDKITKRGDDAFDKFVSVLKETDGYEFIAEELEGAAAKLTLRGKDSEWDEVDGARAAAAKPTSKPASITQENDSLEEGDSADDEKIRLLSQDISVTMKTRHSLQLSSPWYRFSVLGMKVVCRDPIDFSRFSLIGANLTNVQVILILVYVVLHIFEVQCVSVDRATNGIVTFALILPLLQWVATITAVTEQKKLTVKRLSLGTLMQSNPEYVNMKEELEQIDKDRKSNYTFLRAIVLCAVALEIVVCLFLFVLAVEKSAAIIWITFVVLAVDLVYNIPLLSNRYWKQDPDPIYLNERFGISKVDLEQRLAKYKGSFST